MGVVAATGVVAVAIVAMTAQVGATSRAPIAQHALGPSTVVLRLPHADELVESDKPSGGIPATCFSFRSLPSCGCFHMQSADELVESDKPSGGILATCFSVREVILHVV